MIEHINRELLGSITFRYASQKDNKKVLQEMGMEPENVEEMLVFLRDRNKTDSLESLLDKPFEPKSQLDPEPTRFSDGAIRVFYSALEPETAQAEVSAWYVKFALNNAGEDRIAYYQRFSCDFQGTVKDLRPHLAAIPCLIQDKATGYPDCNRIGTEAATEGLDGLLTPSARKPEGTCLPVFRREALSNPQGQDFVAFKLDPSSGKISIVAG